MKTIILIIIAFIGLVLTVVPSFLVFYDSISLDMHKNLMIAGTIFWFTTAPFLVKKSEQL